MSWTMPFVAGETPDPEAIYAMVRRHSVPDNEIGASVGLDAALVRTDELAVAVEGFRAYSTGVGFRLRVLARHDRQGGLSDVVLGGRGRAEGGAFWVGVEFADGRRATTAGPSPAGLDPDGPLLARGGGGGGDREVGLDYFLSPVPPAGPLTFYVLCAELGVEQTAVTIDASPLAEALPRVVELWPWEPESPSPREPEPPSFPPGTWFSQTE